MLIYHQIDYNLKNPEMNTNDPDYQITLQSTPGWVADRIRSIVSHQSTNMASGIIKI